MNKIGDVIAGYRLDELVGEGGMGVVWAATQISLDRTVALKVVRSELAADAEFRDRFVTESRIAASLEDPNVVSVYDAGEEGEVLFLAMAFVAGTDLRSLLRERGSLDPQSAVAVISQVASGLKAVHDAGLVHRDVKPANVLIRARDGEALLTDFGLARAVNASKVTRTGMLIGTLDYMAPEQIEGKRVDGRSDVYSLGAVLYEALTGKPPFTRETIAAQMHAHLNDPPPRPSEHDPSLERFDSVIASSLSKDPAKRPNDPAALAQATRAALGEDAPATEAFRAAVTEVSAVSAQTRVHRRRPGAASRDLHTDDDARTRTTGAARNSKPLAWLIGGLVAIAGLALAGLIAVTLLTGSSTGGGATTSDAAVATTSEAAVAPPEPTTKTTLASDFAGEWIGEATQYAPSGTTQRVTLRTYISASGESGSHSEVITGPRGTDNCQGTLSSTSYGVYKYREQADPGCITTTQIRLRLRSEDTLDFGEKYTTRGGQHGRLVGSLRRK